MSRTTVVVIGRKDEEFFPTLATIANQTVEHQLVQVVDLAGKGANWARNWGFQVVNSEFVLFSDNDISWDPNAIEVMQKALDNFHIASYAYCSYRMGGKLYCDQPWDPYLLLQKNYISTMSLIRSEHFPGFDESIQRLQDWDLWLTMLEQGRVGVYVGVHLFSTEIRPGITFGPDSMPWAEAERIVKEKHKL